MIPSTRLCEIRNCELENDSIPFMITLIPRMARIRFLRIAIPVPWGILEELEQELELKES